MLNFLFGFHGRIRRSHFFLGSLSVWIVTAILGVAGFAAMNINVSDGADGVNWDVDPSPISAAVLGVLAIVAFWSLLAITVKRWHDVGVTGWFSILSLPMITHGPVFLLLCLLPGTEGANRYGSDPRGRRGPIPYEPAPAPAPMPAPLSVDEPLSAPI